MKRFASPTDSVASMVITGSLGILLVVLIGGCQTFRAAAIDDKIALARDLTFRGLNALHCGRADQAEEFLDRAAQNCPTDQRIRQHLATALRNQGQIDRAIEELTVAVEQCANDPQLHVELGELYLMQQRPDVALKHADAALQQNRQLASAWLLKGRSHRATDQHYEALSCFHRAASCQTDLSETQLEIARSYRQLGQPMRALTALELYSQQFPADRIPTEALRLTGQTLADLKQFPRAIDTLVSATQRPESDPDVWIALSQVQLQSGDVSNARLTALAAEQRFDNDAAIRHWLAQLAQRDVQPLHAAR